MILAVKKFGSKWAVGFPYMLTSDGYRLPTPELEELASWWVVQHVDPVELCGSLARLLTRLELAVRRESPPVAFQVERLDAVVFDSSLVPRRNSA